MKKCKIIKVIIISMVLVLFLSSSTLAITTDSIFSDTNLSNINQGVTDSSDSGIFGAINTVIGLLQVAGTGISLIMISTLGIKYILASVEEKAEIKKTAMPILIGAVLLFGAVNIIAVVEEFSNSVINS